MFDSHIHLIDRNELYKDDFSFSIQNLQEYLNTLDGAIVMPLITQYSDSYIVNKNFMNVIQGVPKVYPFTFVHPSDVRRTLIELNPVGIKLHPSISQFIATEQEDMFDLIESYRKPILIHCGRGEKSRLKYIINIAKRNPTLKIIVAHLGGLATELILESVSRMETEDINNLWFDTAGIFHPKLIIKMANVVGIDRIVYGTDVPFFDPRISEVVIKSCEFNNVDLEKICSQNIMEVLK